MAKSKSANIRDINSKRDVVVGDQTNYYITSVVQVSTFTPPPDLLKIRADYLTYLRQTYRALDFRGVRQLDAFAKELLLEDVYVPLLARPEAPGMETSERLLAGRQVEKDTFSPEILATLEQASSRPIKVEEALGSQARVVVLGDPGSGKSTLLKYLALRLAAEPEAPLPILVPLNAYARTLGRGDLSLQSFLPQYFAGLAKGVENLQPLFDAAIQAGQALILLDGLDEVQDGRAYLVHKVEAFAGEAIAKGNKLVITSRIVGYKDAPLSPQDWSLYTLLDFDRAAVESFATKWCLAFERGTTGSDNATVRAAAEIERRGLMDAIEANAGVARLASNPLLLTILALIKRQGVSLPHRRVELYDLYLDTLIRSWNKARALDRQQVGPDLDTNEILMTLGPLALWLRQENPTAGVVSEEALLAELTQHFMGEDWGLKRGEAVKRAHDFLESVQRYSNLLVERGSKQYGFLHLTFEEMLAAYGLYQLGVEASLPIIQAHIVDPAWRETLLLAVGVWGLANKNPRDAGKVVRAMLAMSFEGENICQNVLVAGICLNDVGETGMGRAVASEVVDALIATSVNSAMPPNTRRDAGFILGHLITNTPALFDRVCPDIDAFVEIPEGAFLFGPDNETRSVSLYQIGKYPVTNFQYRRFIDDGGYTQEHYWSSQGWGWRTGRYKSKAIGELPDWLVRNRPEEKRNEPVYWHDKKWNNPLAPVVGITWFEAEAYATWLSEKLGKPVRLPTEEEWERAGRSVKGCKFSWGDEGQANKLNCSEFWRGHTTIGSTTIVSQFPEGRSLEGVYDLNGNVWEWTDSWYEKEQINRVLKGGSWVDFLGDARSTARYKYVPDGYLFFVGFRLVIPGK